MRMPTLKRIRGNGTTMVCLSYWQKIGGTTLETGGLAIATCMFCGHTLHKTKNTKHRCPVFEQEELTLGILQFAKQGHPTNTIVNDL